jgi:hypothetical protein
MIVIKTIIGLITISTALIVLYVIGRITIRIIEPTNQHPPALQIALAAAVGVLVLAVCGCMLIAMYHIGSSILSVLGY